MGGKKNTSLQKNSMAGVAMFTTCWTCGIVAEKGACRICTGCMNARYCSKRCQALDWHEHKLACHSCGKKARRVVNNRCKRAVQWLVEGDNNLVASGVAEILREAPLTVGLIVIRYNDGVNSRDGDGAEVVAVDLQKVPRTNEDPKLSRFPRCFPASITNPRNHVRNHPDELHFAILVQHKGLVKMLPMCLRRETFMPKSPKSALTRAVR